MGKQDYKLFTTISGNKICGTKSRFKKSGNSFENHISSHVSIVIINILEVIKIDHQHGQVCIQTLMAFEFLNEPLVKTATVKNSGESVTVSASLDFSEHKRVVKRK